MSVHGLPPRDEPFDSRLAALTHAGAAADLAEQGPQSLGESDPRGMARVVGELANAVACGLVYIGDSVRLLQQVDAGPVEVMFESTAGLVRALERIRDQRPGSGPPDDELHEMREIAREALRIGYPTSDELPEGPTFRERRPEFRSEAERVLWDKRAMMPEHSEEIVEDVLDVVEKLLNGRVPESGPTPTDSWREFLREQAAQIPEGIEFALRELLSQLEGQSLEFELREPVQSLTDWLNQLANVRGEVADGGAGE